MARRKSVEQQIETSYRSAVKKIENAMNGVEPTTRFYLDCVKAIADLGRKYRAERAERGLDPQDIGTATQKQWDFKATISQSGGVLNQPALTAKDQKFYEELDQEFGTLPAAETEQEEKRNK